AFTGQKRALSALISPASSLSEREMRSRNFISRDRKKDCSMLESLKPLYNRSSHLGEQLVSDGLISQDQLQNALVQQAQNKKRLGETLLHMNLVPAKTLGRYVSEHIRCRFVELTDFEIDESLIKPFPEYRARSLKALPIQVQNNAVIVAMSDPLNLNAEEE